MVAILLWVVARLLLGGYSAFAILLLLLSVRVLVAVAVARSLLMFARTLLDDAYDVAK